MLSDVVQQSMAMFISPKMLTGILAWRSCPSARRSAPDRCRKEERWCPSSSGGGLLAVAATCQSENTPGCCLEPERIGLLGLRGGLRAFGGEVVPDDPDQNVGGLLGVDVPGINKVPWPNWALKTAQTHARAAASVFPVRGEPDPAADDVGAQRRDDPGEFGAPLVRGGENAPQQAAVGGWPGHCPAAPWTARARPGARLRQRLAGVRAILAEAVGEHGQQQRADVVEVPVERAGG